MFIVIVEYIKHLTGILPICKPQESWKRKRIL